MSKGSRAMVAVAVGLLAAIGIVGAAAAQSGAPTPELRALDNANRIKDPGEKLDALRKVQIDLQGSIAVFVARQVDEAILWHLAVHFPNRRDEIVPAFEKVLSSAVPGALGTTGLPTIVNRLLDHDVVLDAAEKPLREAIDKSLASPQAVPPANPTFAERVMSEFSMAPETSRALAFEALGRLHAAQGKADLAEQDYRDAIGASPALSHAPLALAAIEVKRGNKAAALAAYLLAAAAGKLKAGDEAALRSLYRDVNGTDATLEREIDRVYDTHFPNPIAATRFAPQAGTSRVVLLELFTGSACGPCVSADLSWDAILERYPDTLIAPIAYHAHVPGPDPMVVAATAARRQSYLATGVPALYIDGRPHPRVGGTRRMAVRQYEETIAAIDKAFAAPPAAVVHVRAERRERQIRVTAGVARLPAGAANLRLHVVLAERHLSYSGENGIRHHTMVVRAIAGDGRGIPIAGSSETTVDETFDLATIEADVEQTLEAEIAQRRTSRAGAVMPPDYRAEGNAMSAIDPHALVVVAFVQDGARNVLQAARATVK